MTDTENKEQTPEVAPQEDDTVELTEASDTDIDAFLATQEKAERETPAEDAPETPDLEAPEGDSKKQAKPTAPETAKPQAKPEQDAEGYKKQLRDKELFIQRQAYEIGQLRKQAQERIAAKKEGLDERFLESPQQAVDDKLEIKELEAQDRELADRSRKLQSQALLERHVKPRPELPGAIIECLKADGVDPEYIQQFENDPFGSAGTGEIIQLAKRAEAHLAAKELYGYVQQLLQERQTSKGQSERVLDQVDAALRAPPRLVGGGHSPSRKVGIEASQLSTMPYSELESYLASVE